MLKSFTNKVSTILRDTFGLFNSQALEVFGAQPSRAGIPINRISIEGIPAFDRAIDLLSSVIAKTPCNFYNILPGNNKQISRDHPGHKLLNSEANILLTSFVVRRQCIQDSIWNGSGYIWIDRLNSKPVALWNLCPESTFPYIEWTVEGDRPVAPTVWYQTTIGGKTYHLPFDEVIHIKSSLTQYNGLVGQRLVDYAKDSLGLAVAEIRHGASYFRNNGGIMTYITTPQRFKDEQALNQFRAGIEEKHTGVDNAARLLILQGEGSAVGKLTVSNDEMQFIDSRKLSLIDVANLVGVNPQWLGAEATHSYGSVDADNTAALDFVWDKWLVNVEQEFSMKLLTEAEKASGLVIVKFDRNGLSAGDGASWETRVTNLVNQGMISWEMGCERLDLPTVKDPNHSWRLPVQIVLEGEDKLEDTQEVPGQSTTQEPVQDKAPDNSQMRSILRSTVTRLITRIQKDPEVYLGKHEQVFRDSLPGCDGVVDNFFSNMQQELDAVLPEQKKAVIEAIDIESLTGAIWDSITTKQ